MERTQVTGEAASVEEELNGPDVRHRSRQLLGERIRSERIAQRIGVRELGRLVDCSASLISQIELGKANPSVSTLYSIASVLNISVDKLFAESPPDSEKEPAQVPREMPSSARSAFQEMEAAASIPRLTAHEGSVIQRRSRRPAIDLDRGVRWELLVPVPEKNAEFMEVTYAPGGGSAPEDHAIRHNGREYCVILEGVLSIQIGFETYELNPGDSMAFDSTIPHRFWNAGQAPVRAIWFVLDRWAVGNP